MLTDLPNLLTLSRIAAIPLLVACVAVRLPLYDLAACVIFTLAGITDYLDGRIARGRSQLSDLGRMLDPIADKLLVGACLMVLAGEGRLPLLALYPATIILPVTRLAKWKTGFQMAALGTLLAGDSTGRLLGLPLLPVGLIGGLMLWTAAALTLITGWDYLMAGLQHVGRMRPKSAGAMQP